MRNQTTVIKRKLGGKELGRWDGGRGEGKTLKACSTVVACRRGWCPGSQCKEGNTVKRFGVTAQSPSRGSEAQLLRSVYSPGSREYSRILQTTFLAETLSEHRDLQGSSLFGRFSLLLPFEATSGPQAAYTSLLCSHPLQS